MKYQEVVREGGIDSDRAPSGYDVYSPSSANNFVGGPESWGEGYAGNKYKGGNCKCYCVIFLVVLLLLAGATYYFYGNPFEKKIVEEQTENRNKVASAANKNQKKYVSSQS